MKAVKYGKYVQYKFGTSDFYSNPLFGACSHCGKRYCVLIQHLLTDVYVHNSELS